MVWRGISVAGKTSFTVIYLKRNTENYMAILEDFLLPFLICLHCENHLFMQQNAPENCAFAVKQWFMQANVDVINLPTYSPDLNRKEKVWGAPSTMIYRIRRQYKSVYELNHSVLMNWKFLSQYMILHPF